MITLFSIGIIVFIITLIRTLKRNDYGIIVFNPRTIFDFFAFVAGLGSILILLALLIWLYLP